MPRKNYYSVKLVSLFVENKNYAIPFIQKFLHLFCQRTFKRYIYLKLLKSSIRCNSKTFKRFFIFCNTFSGSFFVTKNTLNMSKELSILWPSWLLSKYDLKDFGLYDREVFRKLKNPRFLHKIVELKVPTAPENVRYCAAGQLLVAGRFSKGDF